VLLASLGLLFALLAAAALNGRALVDARARATAALAAETAETVGALRAQAARYAASPVSPAPAAIEPGSVGYSVLTRHVVLPPATLAPLAVGQSDLLPASYPVTARGAHGFLAVGELDNALRLAIGSFDVAFVIVWLLPLVIIALSFDLVARERESGVLPLAVAHGVRLPAYVARKCLARALVVLGAVVIGTLVALAIARVPLATPRGLALGGLWVLATTLYGAFWFALALFVNARPRSSDVNAAWLAGSWLVFTVVAPAATNLLATTLYPAPSRVELTTELREATEAADKAAAEAREQYFFDHPELAGGEMDTSAFFRTVAQTEASVARAMRSQLAAFERQALAQQRVVDGLQFLSPGTVTYQALTALAGSDGARHRGFREQTLAFHDRWVTFFRSRLEGGALLTPADFDALPEFEFAEPPVGGTAMRIAPALIALALAAVALATVAAVRLRRYPVAAAAV
jgi:ABC-2 type transport system permease protein